MPTPIFSTHFYGWVVTEGYIRGFGVTRTGTKDRRDLRMVATSDIRQHSYYAPMIMLQSINSRILTTLISLSNTTPIWDLLDGLNRQTEKNLSLEEFPHLLNENLYRPRLQQRWCPCPSRVHEKQWIGESNWHTPVMKTLLLIQSEWLDMWTKLPKNVTSMVTTSFAS